MKGTIEMADIIVKGHSDNTVTIVRNDRPTHNASRIVRSPEINVRCFSDAEIEHLRKIDVSAIYCEIPNERCSFWEKYVSPEIGKIIK